MKMLFLPTFAYSVQSIKKPAGEVHKLRTPFQAPKSQSGRELSERKDEANWETQGVEGQRNHTCTPPARGHIMRHDQTSFRDRLSCLRCSVVKMSVSRGLVVSFSRFLIKLRHSSHFLHFLHFLVFLVFLVVLVVLVKMKPCLSENHSERQPRLPGTNEIVPLFVVSVFSPNRDLHLSRIRNWGLPFHI